MQADRLAREVPILLQNYFWTPRAQHTTCVEVKPQEVPCVPAINYRITDEAALTRYIETGRRYVASQDLCRACGLKTI